MGEGEREKMYIQGGTAWAKARKQKSTSIWERVGKEVGFG